MHAPIHIVLNYPQTSALSSSARKTLYKLYGIKISQVSPCVPKTQACHRREGFRPNGVNKSRKSKYDASIRSCFCLRDGHICSIWTTFESAYARRSMGGNLKYPIAISTPICTKMSQTSNLSLFRPLSNTSPALSNFSFSSQPSPRFHLPSSHGVD